MSQTLKVLAALVFVAVLGWVLLQPVLDAVEIDTTETDVEQTATPLESRESSPSEAPSPVPSDSEEEVAGLPEGFRTQPLFDAVPKACQTEVTPPQVSAIATLQKSLKRWGPRSERRVIRQVTPGAPVLSSEPEHGPPVAYSVSGVLAAGLHPPELVFPQAESGGAEPSFNALPLEGSFTSWAWSPIADCAFAVQEDGTFLLVHEKGSATLVRGGVRSAAFSPDGRKFAVVTAEDEATSIWIAPLDGDRMREVMRDRAGAHIRLLGWSADGRAVFFTARDGGISFVSTSDPPQTGGISVRPIEELERCGDRVLAIVGGRIAEISIRGPEYLTSGTEGYRHISCAPAGNFIAAIGDDGLVLLDGNGNFLRDLTQDSGYSDVFVDWGGAGRGLLFGRVQEQGSPVAAELWYISEGGSPIPTGVTYRGGPHAVEWSGSPPTGLP